MSIYKESFSEQRRIRVLFCQDFRGLILNIKRLVEEDFQETCLSHFNKVILEKMKGISHERVTFILVLSFNALKNN